MGKKGGRKGRRPEGPSFNTMVASARAVANGNPESLTDTVLSAYDEALEGMRSLRFTRTNEATRKQEQYVPHEEILKPIEAVVDEAREYLLDPELSTQAIDENFLRTLYGGIHQGLADMLHLVPIDAIGRHSYILFFGNPDTPDPNRHRIRFMDALVKFAHAATMQAIRNNDYHGDRASFNGSEMTNWNDYVRALNRSHDFLDQHMLLQTQKDEQMEALDARRRDEDMDDKKYNNAVARIDQAANRQKVNMENTSRVAYQAGMKFVLPADFMLSKGVSRLYER